MSEFDGKQTKIGSCKIGGIFIGNGVCSDVLEHYAISVLMSLNGEDFEITTSNGEVKTFSAVIIQKNTAFRLESAINQVLAFVHILPYCDVGRQLSQDEKFTDISGTEELTRIQEPLRNWVQSDHNSSTEVRDIIDTLSIFASPNEQINTIDPRIMKALYIIMDSEEQKVRVGVIAREVCLSVSHFNRLIKKETGLSFRKFVLHIKLVKSIMAMGDDMSLTQASFAGGFSDQAHMSRTFKKSFGIKPSLANK